jgi:hypothetical protein
MTTAGNFAKETNIYVSTTSKLSFEQTQSVKNELLHILGYSTTFSGFKFHFIDGGEGVQANVFVDEELRISMGN